MLALVAEGRAEVSGRAAGCRPLHGGWARRGTRLKADVLGASIHRPLRDEAMAVADPLGQGIQSDSVARRRWTRTD